MRDTDHELTDRFASRGLVVLRIGSDTWKVMISGFVPHEGAPAVIATLDLTRYRSIDCSTVRCGQNNQRRDVTIIVQCDAAALEDLCVALFGGG